MESFPFFQLPLRHIRSRLASSTSHTTYFQKQSTECTLDLCSHRFVSPKPSLFTKAIPDPSECPSQSLPSYANLTALSRRTGFICTGAVRNEARNPHISIESPRSSGVWRLGDVRWPRETAPLPLLLSGKEKLVFFCANQSASCSISAAIAGRVQCPLEPILLGRDSDV